MIWFEFKWTFFPTKNDGINFSTELGIWTRTRSSTNQRPDYRWSKTQSSYRLKLSLYPKPREIIVFCRYELEPFGWWSGFPGKVTHIIRVIYTGSSLWPRNGSEGVHVLDLFRKCNFAPEFFGSLSIFSNAQFWTRRVWAKIASAKQIQYWILSNTSLIHN